MTKNKLLSPFAIVMIAGIVACTLVEFFLNYDGGPVSVISIVTMCAAIFGVVNCVMSSDGSIWNFIFGLPAVVLQGVVSLNEGNYGIGWMALAFLTPMQIVGFFMWMRHGAELSSDGQQAQVQGRRLSWAQRLVVAMVVAAGTAGLSILLRHVGSNSPVLDAGAVVMQVVAQILMTFAFMEQWVLWMIVNSVYLGLWTHTYVLSFSNPEISGSNALLMIFMWVFYLIISIHGFRVWMKISE